MHSHHPQPTTSPQTFTAIVHSDSPLAVSFSDQDDGTWFRLLNWLIDSGIWASLCNDAQALLPVLSRHSRREDSLSIFPNVPTIAALAGISPSGFKRGREDLLKRGIITQIHPCCFVVFPGRSFRSASRSTGGPARSTGGPLTHEPWSTGGPKRTTGGPPLIREERLENDDGEGVVGTCLDLPAGRDAHDFAAAAALLQAEGFGAEDVTRFAKVATCAQIRGYIGNANEIERRGEPWRTSRRAYLVKAIQNGYSLFAKVEARQVAERMPELGEKLLSIVKPRLDPTREDHKALLSVYPDPVETIKRGGLTVREIDTLGADEAFDLLLSRAKARAAKRRAGA